MAVEIGSIVECRWKDHNSTSDVVLADTKFAPVVITTYGVLVYQNKEVTVISKQHSDTLDDVQVIVAPHVIELTQLYED